MGRKELKKAIEAADDARTSLVFSGDFYRGDDVVARGPGLVEGIAADKAAQLLKDFPQWHKPGSRAGKQILAYQKKLAAEAQDADTDGDDDAQE